MSSDSVDPHVAEPKVAEARVAGRRRHWQWNLSTLFVLMAAVGAWTAYVQGKRESAKLQLEIATMRALAHKLVVDDPAKFAVVEFEELWSGDDRWDVYLPPGSDYRLKLATREIDTDYFPAAGWEVPIAAGRHTLSIVLSQNATSGAWEPVVSQDDQPKIQASEPGEWMPSRGSLDNIVHSQASQSSVDKPLVLKRQRFNLPNGSGSFSPQGPVSGLLLWIERTVPATSESP